MSLLPQQILPESIALGRVLPDGTVRIDHNWYLLLYNICLQILGTSAAPTLPSSSLQALAELDSETADADAIVLRLPIEALAQLLPTEGDPPQDLSGLLTLADAGLLPDPAPQAPPAQTLTVGASPWAYTALFDGMVSLDGGTVSAISLTRQGTTVATGLTSGLFPLRRLDVLTVTYTVAPTAVFLPN